MSKKIRKITLGKGGLGERIIAVDKIEIPDLWNIYMQMKLKFKEPESADAILKCWHLAHDMKKALLE